uniref:Uncharacterized protein K02A2.6-like n=1 Tax=Saccoglossus kowalevskii TaxID=10224 RepID=A0ABM0M1F2_SACKO
MEDTRRAGIKLNRDKCHIKSRECNFYGMLYTAEGVKPSPDKVRAIEMMQPPNDKKELRTFLGLVTYMGPFIPKLSDHTASLRELIKDNSEFVWTPTHTKSFDKIKSLISAEITLAYYNQKKPVILEVDASSKGWPDSIKKVLSVLRPYWSVRDDISIEDGTVLTGSRILIPTALRDDILQQIHKGHLGMEKCKLRAKSSVYWPGIYKDIDNLVANCTSCQKFHNLQQKEPIIPTEAPPSPWHTVGADLFYTNNTWYLIIANYYSKFPFIRKLENLRASTIIRLTKVLFAEQGIPESFICDNGSQFTSRDFRNLANQYGFEIITSSPYYSKGHGFIERHIQT